MRILKLNARSRTPGFAYIHAPPALNCSDVCSQNRQNPRESNSKATQSTVMSKRTANPGGAQVSKRRPNFTGAEVEVLLQNVDVSLLFHYGYIHAIELSAYLFIHCHLQCSCSAFIYFKTTRLVLVPESLLYM